MEGFFLAIINLIFYKLCMKMRKIILFICLFIACVSVVWIKNMFFVPKTEPLVSIIVAVYNRESFVDKTIKSILNQTYKNFELLVIDDGSKDASFEIVSQFAKKDLRVKVIQLPYNQGVSAARNMGLKLAKGKYIATLDSDDEAYPTWIEKSVLYMEKNPHVTMGYPKINCRNDDTPEKKIEPLTKHKMNQLFYHSIINVGSIYRKDFIEQHRIRYNTEFISGEDYDFIMMGLANGGRVEQIVSDEALILYRVHSTNPKEYYNKGFETQRLILKKVFAGTSIDFSKMNSHCTLFKAFIKKYPNAFDWKTKIKGYGEYCLLID